MVESISVWPLLITVFASILKVFLLCFAGWILARRGILDKNSQRIINRLNVSLFTPALLFSKVAFFLSPSKLSQLWIIPLLFCVVTSVSMLVSWSLGRVLRLKRTQSAFAMAAAMFMNSNSLPVALMQSLVVTVKGLEWYQDDTEDEMIGRALTYLMLYSMLGMILRWSYGVHLLGHADKSITVHPQDETVPLYPNSRGELLSTTASQQFLSTDGSRIPVEHPNRNLSNGDQLSLASPRPGFSRRSPFVDSFPDVPRISPTSLASTDDDLPPNLQAERQSLFSRQFTKINSFMTAPLWAALASLVVASIEPLQNTLMHLKPLEEALAAAGDCSIPLTLVVLGGYFHSDDGTQLSLPETNASRLSRGNTLAGSMGKIKARKGRRDSDFRPGEAKTVVVAILSRMFLTPLILLPFVAFLTLIDAHEVFDDPIFVVSCVLLIASPPALTLAQISQVASGDAFERLISSTIFWSYCVLTPLSTIAYVVLGLMMSKL